ncbi:hypothetical protein OW684_18900 [Acinetobacter baumannii]|uniref:hypothetical protein n=1 Tax=Acinetobacter baumannii TaxID=470 RepID=UPI0023409D61|nr:hypothetical protein [Acinetobacter baumannii]MDC4743379.1 hypothetical protein [Acinetobacter baumannii]MDC5076691.1 hypothetical protein [Acinetobacter baumannii]MDC5255796.1 hypothetical protein [Acinetobacter baumannii]MDK2108461.1 hypothetical protein [Acinetobacter baumannii]MDK2113796.1 hypothetical protein [Acinetobacter baumannii]
MINFTPTYLEHDVAARFERDINQMYLRVRFKHGGDYDHKYWFERFLEYYNFWNFLCITNELQSGIWIESFRQCFYASKQELMRPGVPPVHVPEYREQLLELILAKLVKIFSVPAFLEELKATEEKHGKLVERYSNAYDEATKHYFDLNKINLFLGYLPDYANYVSILDMAKHIRSFEKFLNQFRYFPVDYLFQYQRVVRLPEKNEYGLLLSLTLNANIYQDRVPIVMMLIQLWYFATESMGMGIELDTEMTAQNHPVGFMFGEFDDVSDFDLLLRQDLTSTAETSTNVRVWPIGFKHFIGRVPHRRG